MKLKIDKAELVKEIEKVIGATGEGSNMPILRHILLKVSGDTATMSATDLSVELTTEFPVLDGEDGLIAIPGKKMHEIVKELPNGEVSISTTAGNSTINITAAKARFNIAGLDGQEFPALKSPETEKIVPFGADALALFLNQVKASICSDETKINLCGVYIHTKDGNLCFASTNGHRLSRVQRKKDLPEGFISKNGITVPKKGVLEIIKLADTVKGGGKLSLAIKDNSLHAQTDSTRLAVRLMDMDFPDYERVIPTEAGQVAVIEKQALTQALKRISVVNDGKDCRTKLIFSENLINVSATSAVLGDGTEEFAIQYAGGLVEVNINARYTLDAIAALDKDDDVTLTIHGENKPVTIGNKNGFLAVIMPMRA